MSVMKPPSRKAKRLAWNGLVMASLLAACLPATLWARNCWWECYDVTVSIYGEPDIPLLLPPTAAQAKIFLRPEPPNVRLQSYAGRLQLTYDGAKSLGTSE